MTNQNYKRKARRNLSRPAAVAPIQPTQTRRMPGILGWLTARPKLLGWLELVVCIMLIMFAFKGFLDGAVWLPFGFGLLGLRFFYGYIQHNLGVQLGKTALLLNLVLLIGALVCLIIGLANEGSNY